MLIVGSLLWRQTTEREQWRQSRLLVGEKSSVQAGIYYGRLSKGGTYTMTFDAGREMGGAVLVPCKAEITSMQDLVAEAQSFWGAESTTAKPGCVGASWGCVGLAFRGDRAKGLGAEWANWFGKSKTQPVAPVDETGVLRIPWPPGARESDIEIILATSTAPERPRATAQKMADAWIAMGGEDYFFGNVENGIRTPDDLAIWRRMEERRALCLAKAEYARVAWCSGARRLRRARRVGSGGR